MAKYMPNALRELSRLTGWQAAGGLTLARVGPQNPIRPHIAGWPVLNCGTHIP
jgi:hypothetical protein